MKERQYVADLGHRASGRVFRIWFYGESTELARDHARCLSWGPDSAIPGETLEVMKVRRADPEVPNDQAGVFIEV